MAFLLVLGACSSEEATPPETSCPPGQDLCGGACVDLRFDDLHCGACDAACGAESSCVLGVCTARCEPPFIVCGESCVDPRSDQAHCGACEQACAPEQICAEGACQTVCEEGQAACDGDCVDTDTDSSHCGACGHICWEGQTCVDGDCVCPAPLEDCNGLCTDTGTDRENCGACGASCPGSMHCVDGACGCPEGLERCGDRCVDTRADLNNCGACGKVCADRPNASTSCNAGSCEWSCLGAWEDCDGNPENGCETDTSSELAHCGACGSDCSALANVDAATCSGGRCVVLTCETGWDRCGSDPLPGCETDLSSDSEHCGACNVSCVDLPKSTGSSCEDFACALDGCLEGWEDCDGDARNGCEAELAVDNENCGACGSVCDGLCIDGGCVMADYVESAGSVACAKLTNGQVACWGKNSWGQVGRGVTGLVDTLQPHIVPGLQDIETLSLGEWHACAVDKQGVLYCWGDNRQGQLGDGTLEQRNTPVMIPTPHPVRSVYGGPKSTCVTYVNDETWCWGENLSGQFGDGTLDDKPEESTLLTPRKMALHGVSKLFMGDRSSCARVGADLFCMGSQATGRLGNQVTTGSSLVPVAPAGLETDVDLPLGGVASSHTCVVLPNKLVKCWGSNSNGQLGNGKLGYSEYESRPVLVSNLTGVEQVSVSNNHTCALLEDGTVQCWGLNQYGKLGDGTSGVVGSGMEATTVSKSLPEPVVQLSNVRQISASKSTTCAVLKDGNLLCWGQGTSGNLGNGTKEDSYVPVSVQWR